MYTICYYLNGMFFIGIEMDTVLWITAFAVKRCYWIQNYFHKERVLHKFALFIVLNMVHVKPFDCNHNHSKDLFNLFL